VALTQQTLPSSAFPVGQITVTDNTSVVCKVFQERFDNFRGVYEPSQGLLKKVRNTGLGKSLKVSIAYLDDDAPPQKWVEAI
jgi:hypothetical protein